MGIRFSRHTRITIIIVITIVATINVMERNTYTLFDTFRTINFRLSPKINFHLDAGELYVCINVSQMCSFTAPNIHKNCTFDDRIFILLFKI